MPQATFSIRMDENLKRQFDELCNEFGMTATTAFNVFARAVVREKKFPSRSKLPMIPCRRKQKTLFMHCGKPLRKTAFRI